MYCENVPIIILTISAVVTYLILYVSNTILVCPDHFRLP